MDYRDLAGERFDAIASIGMVEHVGAEQIDVYARTPRGAAASRAGGCSTTASPASATATPRPAPSRSATSSPTPSRCTSRGCCWRSSGPASSTRARRGASAPTTPRRCATGRAASTRTSSEADPARRPRAGARLAPLPARGPQRLRDRLHLDLPRPTGPGAAQEPPHSSTSPAQAAPLVRALRYDASRAAEFRGAVDQAAQIWNSSATDVRLVAGTPADFVVIADNGWPAPAHEPGPGHHLDGQGGHLTGLQPGAHRRPRDTGHILGLPTAHRPLPPT